MDVSGQLNASAVLLPPPPGGGALFSFGGGGGGGGGREGGGGGGVVRRSLLVRGGTSNKRPSLHLHKVLTQSNKVIPRIFQMALLFILHGVCEKLLLQYCSTVPHLNYILHNFLYDRTCLID